MTAVSYHHTVNDLQGLAFTGQGPFARREWFALLENAGARPLVALACEGDDAVALPLARGEDGLENLTNWYAFTWTELATGPTARPALLERLGEPHRAKGNRHDDHEAAGRALPLGVPHRFVGRVEARAARLGPAAVPLHAKRARAKAVRRALVVERVHHQADAVVIFDVLARCQVGPDARGVVVERHEHGIQVSRVVA